MNAVDSCPDAERLAGAMTADERATWVDHAATCAVCRALGGVLGVLPDAAPRRERELAPGARIGRYVLEGALGAGAMGVVYAARDPELDRRVAVKLLRGPASPGRLRREAKALARLSHPNVVHVYDVGEHDGHAFVAMELVDGQTLRAWLAEPRPHARIVDVLVQAGRGLAAAHDAGLIHRDFKPENVLLARDGRVLVGDFGLARAIEATTTTADESGEAQPADAALTVTGAVIGTPAYMAPEQVAGEPTPVSDQYAFCVTAWEACFGRRPYAGATVGEQHAAARAGRIERGTRGGGRASRRFEAALRRGLAARADDRFPSMGALLAELAPRAIRRRWIALAAIAIVAAATVAIVLARRGDGGGAATVSVCDHEADAIDEKWNPDIKARLQAAHADPVAIEAFDRWATGWRAARIDVCRAGKERRTISPAHLAARVACYERAREWFLVPQPERAAEALALSRQSASFRPCDSDYPGQPPEPGWGDNRPCGCLFSECTDDGRCLSVCRAKAFRNDGPIPNVSVSNRMEVSYGISDDGDTLAYAGGRTANPDQDDPYTHCDLAHLFVARRSGDEYIPVELTSQLADLGLRHRGARLAPDGRSLVFVREDKRGLFRLRLEGDRLIPVTMDEFGPIAEALPAGHEIRLPVLASDERTLYYAEADASLVVARVATRARRDAPFVPRPDRVGTTANSTENITGVSSDGLTLFVEKDYRTRAMIRPSVDVAFGELTSANHFSGWNMTPVGDCSFLVGVASPGGCQAMDIVKMTAVP
jgi:predicted Ser/Thr protein kinase